MSRGVVHVVDDEDAIRRSTWMILHVMGYEARLHASGAAFLDALDALPAGCVLLDIRMPEIDGLEVQRRLAQAGRELPVVMMSGHGDFTVAAAAMEHGAVAFLEKPFARVVLEPALDLAFLQLENGPRYRDYLKSAAEVVGRFGDSDRQVLQLLARGQDLQSIAISTGLAPVDVELARSRIFAGLGAESMADVLRIIFAAVRADPR